MIESVTLSQTKEYLHTDDDTDDGDLLLKIQSNSVALLSYIQGSRELIISSDENLVEGEPLKRVQGAFLVLLDYPDRNRNGGEEEKLQRGEFPLSVTMLVYDLRRPTTSQRGHYGLFRLRQTARVG